MHIKHIVAAALALCPLGAARAATPGIEGRSDLNADAPCFKNSGGGVTNICGDSRLWYVPFHIAASGNYSVTIYARGPSANSDVCCTAYGVVPTADSPNASSRRCLPAYGPFQRISLSAVYVPSYGALYVACSIGANGVLKTLSY